MDQMTTQVLELWERAVLGNPNQRASIYLFKIKKKIKLQERPLYGWAYAKKRHIIQMMKGPIKVTQASCLSKIPMNFELEFWDCVWYENYLFLKNTQK